MIWWILGIAGWVACGVAAYFFGRCLVRHDNNGIWTRRDRRIHIALAITIPPLCVAAQLCDWISRHDDRPAKW